jgi:hypothetical protein
MLFCRTLPALRLVGLATLVLALLAAAPSAAGGATLDRRGAWVYADVPAWDISHEGLPFRLTWAWDSPLDPLARLLRSSETRWTAGIGYAKVYNSYDATTGRFRSAGGHAALASAGREFRWRLAPETRVGALARLPTVLVEFGVHGASRHFPADGTHFNVPDTLGEFLRMVDSGTGRDPNAGTRTASKPGGAIGDSVGTKEAEDLLAHTHTAGRAGGDRVQAGCLRL